LSNEVGIVNYLIKQKTIEEITNHTHTVSGRYIVRTIPPTSEMILSEGMGELIEELKKKYLYYSITPPVWCLTL
jgi:hypothetical protein